MAAETRDCTSFPEPKTEYTDAICQVLLTDRYFTRYVPTPKEEEFNKRFDREAVLVKTCGPPPGIETAVPAKVYRFEDKLWYHDLQRWRQVDAKPENVCDVLDIEKGHEPKPGPLPPGWSRVS